MREDNLLIVDLSKYNTVEKETKKYIQVNHTTNKKVTEEDIKNPEIIRVRSSMRREDRETAPDGCKMAFEKLSNRWGLLLVDGQIVVPIDLRRRLFDIRLFGHSGMTKMETKAKIFWWPERKNNIKTKFKDYTTRPASGKNMKY